MFLLKTAKYASIPITIIMLSTILIPISDARFAADIIQGMWTFEEGKGVGSVAMQYCLHVRVLLGSQISVVCSIIHRCGSKRYGHLGGVLFFLH